MLLLPRSITIVVASVGVMIQGVHGAAFLGRTNNKNSAFVQHPRMKEENFRLNQADVPLYQPQSPVINGTLMVEDIQDKKFQGKPGDTVGKYSTVQNIVL